MDEIDIENMTPDEIMAARKHAAAVEAGRRGGLIAAKKRREKAAMRSDLRARQAFADASEDIAKELLAAAKGEGIYAALDPKERVAVLKTCLEYGVGRPRSQDPMSIEDDTEESGLLFGTREPDETAATEPGEPGPVREEPAPS